MLDERTILSFDGTLLHACSMGSGPPLVFCDGLGCDGYIWKYLTPALRGQHRLIFWHYPGHGKSCAPKHPHGRDIAALGQDLMRVLAAFEVFDAVMVGHSMGVQLLLDTALLVPEKMVGLVLLCGGPGRPLDTLHGSAALGRAFPYMQALVKTFPNASQKLWRALFKSRLCYAWAQLFEVNGRLLQHQDLDRYFKHLQQMDIHVFVAMLAHLQAHTVVHRLHEVHVPTLIIAGDKDSLTPLRLSEIMQRRMPNAHLKVMHGGTHVAPLELPDLVNQHVLRFVCRLHDAKGSAARAPMRAPEWIKQHTKSRSPLPF